jgi:Ion channel
VLVLSVALLIFLIAAPSGDWTRAVVAALQGAGLTVIIATSRARESARRQRAVIAAAAGLLVVVLIGTGALGVEVALVLNGLLAAAIPLALVGGLVRLLRTRGVTVEAVMGALAIYLLIGLLFVVVMGVVVHADKAAYFSQGTDGTQSDRVYYSFTVLTTTGLGDFTAAQPLGRALAVFEMLVGQLYLVTVIGLLVGSFVARQRAPS